jgi:hypothetical protein
MIHSLHAMKNVLLISKVKIYQQWKKNVLNNVLQNI